MTLLENWDEHDLLSIGWGEAIASCDRYWEAVTRNWKAGCVGHLGSSKPCP